MMQQEAQLILTPALLAAYAGDLREQEKSAATIQKYARDLRALQAYLGGAPLTKAALIGWKNQLAARYAQSSVNSMLAAANGLALYCGMPQLRVKPLKRQNALFCDDARQLTRAEYARLVQAADQNADRRLSLALQTICATGIRVSELQYITAQAVAEGRAQIDNKGKRRTVFLPRQLRGLLAEYLAQQGCRQGAVFVTRRGKPLDRSNIWRQMKTLCRQAGVPPQKAFPHNLRHLFARTYYTRQHDLGRLADILGHTNINTTRIYTAESGVTHARQMEQLELTLG